MLLRAVGRRFSLSGRIGRRRLCTSQPGAAAAAAWAELQDEARAALSTPAYARFGMDRFLFGEVLTHGSLAEALAHELGSKFTANDTDKQVRFEELLLHAFTEDPTLADAAAADMRRFVEVDPASDGILDVLLFFKGFQAVQCARAANYYWREANGEGRAIAKLLQSEMADVFGVDIHPGAVFGRGVTIDHATGVVIGVEIKSFTARSSTSTPSTRRLLDGTQVVIGETAVIGDNVSIMHDVTLGATGTSPDHDRHPKVGNDVLICAGSKVLGNIEISDGAVVAASAVVNKPVAAGHTAVGIPARHLPPRAKKVRKQEL